MNLKQMHQKQYRAACRERKGKNGNAAPARKARTRTLIQAGGLLEKAGLLEFFNLKCGDDLQGEFEIKDNVMAMLGAFIEIKQQIENEDLSKTWLTQKGAATFYKKEGG